MRSSGWRPILREAAASALSQPVASVITILMIAAMCITILLTTGRTAGAEQAVINTLDSAGTRSIIIRASTGSGVDSTVVDRLAAVDGIQWHGAFGPALDSTNAAVPDGTRVPVRTLHTQDLDDLQPSREITLHGPSAFASASGTSLLGLYEGTGTVSSVLGSNDFAIIGAIDVPPHLAFLEPLVIAPQPASASPSEVNVIVIVAERVDLVEPVRHAAISVLGASDPALITVNTSQQIADLRTIVQSQLSTFGRSLVLVVFIITAGISAALLYGLVMMRRKDFGRRRALGASKSLIIKILLIQTALLSGLGTMLGTTAATIVLVNAGDPLPSPQFFLAIAILSITTGTLSALVPAIVAARREPLKELRVP
ncbi:hypothetical protein GCM10027403_12500 [Arthrobacter tecti]